MNWFDVDRDGLAQLVSRKGKAFIIFELVQNAWDEDTTEVSVTLEPITGRPRARLIIEDDSPDGFSDLKHAYTLFAPSKKKNDAHKRGRFNLGEKLVLAMCDEATLISTTGGLRFTKDGRKSLRKKTETGTRFEAIIKLTRTEVSEAVAATKQLRPPRNVQTKINGIHLEFDSPITTAVATLPTEISDDEGNLKRTKRQTDIEIYEPKLACGWIYEMGIPIVETGDRFDVNIAQKVPLSLDRDNVTPAYLAKVRSVVLNQTAKLLTADESSASWVTQGASGDEIESDAIKAIVSKRFGDKAVSYDPSDKESNNRAASDGQQVVHGGSMPASMWKQVKRAEALQPAGRIYPTPKPYSETGKQEKIIPETEWSSEMKSVAVFSKWAAQISLGVEINVLMTEAGTNFSACYGSNPLGQRELTFNLTTLGQNWFSGPPETIVDLVIHELGHELESNHLSDKYYHALTMIAGKLFVNAKDAPTIGN